MAKNRAGILEPGLRGYFNHLTVLAEKSWRVVLSGTHLTPLMSSLALTCGCYEDVCAEFEWDNYLDNTPQPREAVNLSVDSGGTYRCRQNYVVADIHTTGCHGYAPRKDVGTIVCEIPPKTLAE